MKGTAIGPDDGYIKRSMDYNADSEMRIAVMVLECVLIRDGLADLSGFAKLDLEDIRTLSGFCAQQRRIFMLFLFLSLLLYFHLLLVCLLFANCA